ncbi:helix-turn-helix transcriptional regulator [Fervidibacillus halotolerans]|uniref:PhBC6A51 family helix-turn-helix protein n=1 Tax=Fervidibacillus halotolerans TaxID=2980027 RepID=A0A9E8M1S8_9BACI|nr:phBC6A51 family helix-turn-helix protein [Fervidibacillus halotolerans]WAA13387.1 phBC6A51 family helix-turn-helix protein [Fervidibacillus halotolerans]
MAKRKRRKRTRPPLDDRHYTAIYLMTRPFYDKKTGKKRWLTRQEVADMVGVSRMQLWRWEQRKDFQREHDKALKAYLRTLKPKKPRWTVPSSADEINAILRNSGII